MKSINSILVAFFLFSTTIAVAQLEIDYNIELGRSFVSYNLPDNEYSVEYEYPGLTSSFITYNLGLTAPLSERFYLRSELGSIITSADIDVKVLYKSKIEYVHFGGKFNHRYISLMSQYRFSIGSLLMSVSAGPLFASPINSDNRISLHPGIKAGFSGHLDMDNLAFRAGMGYTHITEVYGKSNIFPNQPSHNFNHVHVSFGIIYILPKYQQNVD